MHIKKEADKDVDIMKLLNEKASLTKNDIPDVGKISDGYHTFDSLYFQRLILFATLVNLFPELSWKSELHEDGFPCFGGGWFVVGIHTPQGEYTYHYELEHWDLFRCQHVPKAPLWDGHTDEDVERLLSLVEYNKQQKKDDEKWLKTQNALG